jgi:hypothetical protein
MEVLVFKKTWKRGDWEMASTKDEPLVWVKDNAGNRFLCPMESLIDPNSVTEEEKRNCVDDASRLMDPKSVPGEGKLKFSESKSPA